MPQVSCSTCGKSYTLSDALGGKTVRCKACSGVFTVPHANQRDVEIVDPTLKMPGYANRGKVADEIDYEIFGNELQYVTITLDPHEQVIAEAGALMYMEEPIKMDTVFGDPVEKGTRVLEQGRNGYQACRDAGIVVHDDIYQYRERPSRRCLWSTLPWQDYSPSSRSARW